MNRRDFLNPGQLARTAGHVLGALEELTPPAPSSPPPVEEVQLIHVARRAMATTFEVVLPLGTAGAIPAAESALDEIDALEGQLTVYRDSSEVSRLNRLAYGGPIPVEEQLFGLLETAARITAETGGAYDITAGALIKAWGFYRGPRRVPPEMERRSVLERVGMRHVVLDPEQRTVRFLRNGLEINLGSIGKGYALDRAARLLRDHWNVTAGLLHGGHSSVYAIGSEPGRADGWGVGLRHPWDPTRRLAVVRLRDRALGTSAATFQYLEYNGRKLGHLLDPRSGWPAEGMASASVLAPTAAEADALATAFFILGVEPARAYCERHPGVGAVLLSSEDNALPVILGLAPNEVELATPSV
jgi:thiamine biosynthesis lipoprotein